VKVLPLDNLYNQQNNSERWGIRNLFHLGKIQDIQSLHQSMLLRNNYEKNQLCLVYELALLLDSALDYVPVVSFE